MLNIGKEEIFFNKIISQLRSQQCPMQIVFWKEPCITILVHSLDAYSESYATLSRTFGMKYKLPES